jgi:hypothetical protein
MSSATKDETFVNPGSPSPAAVRTRANSDRIDLIQDADGGNIKPEKIITINIILSKLIA